MKQKNKTVNIFIFLFIYIFLSPTHASDLKNKKINRLRNLPAEILAHIISFCDEKTIYELKKLCKSPQFYLNFIVNPNNYISGQRSFTYDSKNQPDLIVMGAHVLLIGEKEAMLLNIRTMSREGTISIKKNDNIYGYTDNKKDVIVIINDSKLKLTFLNIDEDGKAVSSTEKISPFYKVEKAGNYLCLVSERGFTNINPITNTISNYKTNLDTNKLKKIFQTENNIYFHLEKDKECDTIFIFRKKKSQCVFSKNYLIPGNKKKFIYEKNKTVKFPLICDTYKEGSFIVFFDKSINIFDKDLKVTAPDIYDLTEEISISDKYILLRSSNLVQLFNPNTLEIKNHKYIRKDKTVKTVTIFNLTIFISYKYKKISYFSLENIEPRKHRLFKNKKPILDPIKHNNFLYIAYQEGDEYGVMKLNLSNLNIMDNFKLKNKIIDMKISNNDLIIYQHDKAYTINKFEI